ncbi:MAG: futalosine hydrolase [Planctomycetia bacterium]|nr:futalosine hydrolase [Planctomycetia bacterium]
MLQHLILIPTERERQSVGPIVGRVAGDCVRIELCGFGVAAAAARTAHLLAVLAPSRILLVGSAGQFDTACEIGKAYRFDRVASYGIGVGSGAAFIPAAAIGWPQWPGDPPSAAAVIGDTIRCSTGRVPEAPRADLLLTACAAAADRSDVDARKRLYPAAAAEDMEGFAVALACRLAGTPLDIVRGIANPAGDRDKAHWQLTAALEAAAEIAVRLLADAS